MVDLKVVNLESGYGNNKVVKCVSFECKKKELTFVIGANGCGKSTLLKSIAQLLAYNGNVFVDNVDIKTLKKNEVAKLIAFFSQISVLNLQFSILETVLMGRFPYRKSRLANYNQDDYNIAYNALKKVGLIDVCNNLLSSCSGGQLQRVLIARLIAQNPKIIIIDEITNHLDFKYQIEILEFIKTWALKEDKVVLGVLHDLNLVKEYADKILMMKNGEILYHGKSCDVLTRNKLNEIYDIDVMSWYSNVSKKWREI